MTKKEAFISEIETMINGNNDFKLSDDAATYFEALKNSGDKSAPTFTENGKLVLRYMQENRDTYNNIFTAKSVGEGLGVTSRTASGAARKLVTDGYVEKMGENPVSYSLTQKGIDVNIDAE